jgi:hypothetical protein
MAIEDCSDYHVALFVRRLSLLCVHEGLSRLNWQVTYDLYRNQLIFIVSMAWSKATIQQFNNATINQLNN